ncbi:MAG TPA: (2Fe-2S)-binding protein [Paraburkholderia sp.]|jgi:nicotinate dehydrogenase subunit A|nr:(2Fe-2S)-binding protein [Paraburkholderia sp.]
MPAHSPQSTVSPQHSHSSHSASSVTPAASAGAAAALTISVDGKPHVVQATPDTPLLYVLRNELNLTGPRFGCGLAQCGACTVHLDGAAVRSCVLPVSVVAGHQVTTLQGLAQTVPAEQRVDGLHPVQHAFIEEQAAQCGYCMNSWIMNSAAFLKQNPHASDAEIRAGLTGLKCRCGTHIAILRAVKRAAKAMA